MSAEKAVISDAKMLRYLILPGHHIEGCHTVMAGLQT